jgi:adenosylcobinamide kinase/adenosylcobinamide-phosphate guanylyltransferase
MPILVTGGARSGKSSFAEQLAASLGSSGIYIATAQPFDAEMTERVERHRRQREAGSFPWRTIEEPYDLTGLLRSLNEEEADVDVILGSSANGMESGNPKRFSGSEAEGPGADREWKDLHEQSSVQSRKGRVVLVDCLTIWLSNWVLRYEASGQAEEHSERLIDELAETAAHLRYPVIFVTNEVGSGIVPEYPLGRLYRDLAGRMNQRLAGVSQQVFLVTAGIPVELKSIAFRFNGGIMAEGAE